jgi:hypothetical protein
MGAEAYITLEILTANNRRYDLPKDGTPKPNKIGVMWVVNFNYAPRVHPSTNGFAIYFNFLFRPNNGKG